MTSRSLRGGFAWRIAVAGPQALVDPALQRFNASPATRNGVLLTVPGGRIRLRLAFGYACMLAGYLPYAVRRGCLVNIAQWRLRTISVPGDRGEPSLASCNALRV